MIYLQYVNHFWGKKRGRTFPFRLVFSSEFLGMRLLSITVKSAEAISAQNCNCYTGAEINSGKDGSYFDFFVHKR